jgi:2-deoxy-D-gluconate 3-dehydrogenase
MYGELFDLSGKTGLVTGASRGLGRAMAAACAEMGADVVISARSVDTLEKAAESIKKNGGGAVHTITADMSSDDDIHELVAKSIEALGGNIDFAVLNAGIIRRAPTHEHDLEDFDEVMQVNVHAVFLLVKLVSRVMIENGSGGSIVITDSILSRNGAVNVPGYAASKGAVNTLARASANDLGAYGIRVNTIAPGFCETDMTGALRENDERRETLTSRMALGRWGRPEDLAGAAIYLVSDASSYVTGTTLYVDGGFLSM